MSLQQDGFLLIIRTFKNHKSTYNHMNFILLAILEMNQ